MYYPRLRVALDEYCAYLKSAFQADVQVRTGALRNSIKVSCTVNDIEYSLQVSLNNYWRWLPEPFPWDDAYDAAGVPSVGEYTRHPQRDGYMRYKLNLSVWQDRLNEAFEKDVQAMLNMPLSL